MVDTSVWSLALRRRRVDPQDPWVRVFSAQVEAGHAIFLIGPILQELLDGVRAARDFARLLKILSPFPLLPLERETYVSAARLRNACRRKGVQASAVDFLITAACIEHGYPLLTADSDFLHIARRSELLVLPPLGHKTGST